jgi:hypothetical protein
MKSFLVIDKHKTLLRKSRGRRATFIIKPANGNESYPQVVRKKTAGSPRPRLHESVFYHY